MTDVKSMTIEELTAYMKERGEGAYRARQLFSWMHEKTASSYDQMTNLPKKLRESLPPLVQLQIAQVQKSKKDATRKYLFSLDDGNLIESVYMQYRFGSSVCISSQVGCRMGCAFCASTLEGVVRNLSASEMSPEFCALQKKNGRLSLRLPFMHRPRKKGRC